MTRKDATTETAAKILEKTIEEGANMNAIVTAAATTGREIAIRNATCQSRGKRQVAQAEDVTRSNSTRKISAVRRALAITRTKKRVVANPLEVHRASCSATRPVVMSLSILPLPISKRRRKRLLLRGRTSLSLWSVETELLGIIYRRLIQFK